MAPTEREAMAQCWLRQVGSYREGAQHVCAEGGALKCGAQWHSMHSLWHLHCAHQAVRTHAYFLPPASLPTQAFPGTTPTFVLDLGANAGVAGASLVSIQPSCRTSRLAAVCNCAGCICANSHRRVGAGAPLMHPLPLIALPCRSRDPGQRAVHRDGRQGVHHQP